jgi:hypothetical protein
MVVVADPGNVRLTTFDLGAEERRPFRGSIRPSTPPLDVCTLGSRIYVSSAGGPDVVHEIDPDGSTVSSFAPVPRIPELDGMGAGHLAAQATLACDPASGTVVVASTFVPVVRAYDADGRPRWTVGTLTEWAQQNIGPGPDGRCCMYLRPLPGADRYHTIVAAVVGPGTSSVYVAVRESVTGEAPTYLAYRLAMDSGRELASIETPGLLLELRGERAYFVQESPFPSVVVHRMARWPERDLDAQRSASRKSTVRLTLVARLRGLWVPPSYRYHS